MTTLPLKSIRAGLSLIFTVFHPKLELLNLLRVTFISGSNESCGPYPCQNDHAFACDSDSRKPPQQASQGHMYPEMKVSSLIDLQQPLAFPSVLGQRSCWPRVCESSPKGQGNYPSLHSLQGATERRTCYLYSHRKLIPPPSSAPFSWYLPQKMSFPVLPSKPEGFVQDLGPRGSTSLPFPLPALPILEPPPSPRPAPACSQAPVPSATCPGASLTSAAVLQSSSGLSPRGRREE